MEVERINSKLNRQVMTNGFFEIRGVLMLCKR